MWVFMGFEKSRLALKRAWPKILQVLCIFKEQGLDLAALLSLSAFSFHDRNFNHHTLWPWKVQELVEKVLKNGVFRMLRGDVTRFLRTILIGTTVVNVGPTALVIEAAATISEITPKSTTIHYATEVARAKLRRANVNFLSAPVKDGTTGTVIVLTTPDAQRTMLAYQGTSSIVNYDSSLASVISKTSILVVEGYLFELPHTIKAITKACEDAHRNGALVAVTASDVSCIERHYDDFWEIIGNQADIVFANSDEARALCHFSSTESPVSTTKYLSHFIPLISVTDGCRGSYIGVKGEAVYIPPSPCVPVDTCGAGDAYASGFLYGMLRGTWDLKGMGTLAAKVAAVVVGQQGTRLRVQDAVELAGSFEAHLESSGVISDVESSDHISSL
ncbi:hypothetical protein GIB67_030154 [Kingdonia uniflora]|uniref:Carbohydrate kinase PfkB domain-containing protein n=1 Tax=Kingdonia uniflora TaxID=39325 RepID=A0A7J7LE85_9MAGN|nr:hypothetical protein GIB67_030154 [Kingdonia uniflora]